MPRRTSGACGVSCGTARLAETPKPVCLGVHRLLVGASHERGYWLAEWGDVSFIFHAFSRKKVWKKLRFHIIHFSAFPLSDGSKLAALFQVCENRIPRGTFSYKFSWKTYLKMANLYTWFTYEKLWFSIAMLVYQRVTGWCFAHFFPWHTGEHTGSARQPHAHHSIPGESGL